MKRTIQANEKKLRLSKETIRELIPEELQQVAGGETTVCSCNSTVHAF